jgi:beta-galactosidase/beta-glucuronidase
MKLNFLINGLLILFISACVEVNNNLPQHNTETEKQVLNLSGRWKFSLGDEDEWKDEKFNDSNWEKVSVPSSWENQGFHGYDGYAWYRTSFTVKL